MDATSVTLRPLSSDDLDQLAVWRNDSDVGRDLARRSVTREQLSAWFESQNADIGDRSYAILVDGAFVGYALLNGGDLANRRMEAGLVIGEKSMWGRGLGSIVARKLAAIAFGELRMHRLLAVASERNIGSIRCFQNAGFREEGRLREASFADDAYWDLVLLSQLEPEWRSERIAGAISDAPDIALADV